MAYGMRTHPAPRHTVIQGDQPERIPAAATIHRQQQRQPGLLARVVASIRGWEQRDRDDNLVILFNLSGPTPRVIDIGC